MAQSQINGATQIRSGTITTTQLSSSAGIVDGQLATPYVKADGTRAFTGNLQGGGFEATNFANPTSSTSLATKSYVDSLSQGLDTKPSARAATTGAESFTIASGSVTQISGTTVDGQSPSIGEYILVKDAPSASGAGSAGSNQPGNGLYIVTGNTTNLAVSRAASESGTINPAGDYVFVQSGAANAGAGYTVTTPSTNAAFTYGTGTIQWTQFSGAGEVTVDSTLTKTGNQITRAAITGDITISTNSNASTLATNVVTYAKFQQVAANSVVGNATGSTANATAVAMTAAATASTVVYRDSNANVAANNYARGIATTATAAGTTTLTVSSTQFQQFTGSTTQTVVLPAANTLILGMSYIIANRSTGAVQVNANGGGAIVSVPGGSQTVVTVLNIGSGAGTWDANSVSSGSGSVTTVSVVTANGFAGTVANATSTPAITLTTSITGVLKGNGTAISAAAAGTDYMAPANFVVRETPSGTINGSNATFTLANTPVSGTEEVYLNGLLQDPGAGNDYTISGATITMLNVPVPGDKLRTTYMK